MKFTKDFMLVKQRIIKLVDIYFSPSPPSRPSVESSLYLIILNRRAKGKRVSVMLPGDDGATLERQWSYQQGGREGASRWLKKQMERVRRYLVREGYHKEEWRGREMGKEKGKKE